MTVVEKRGAVKRQREPQPSEFLLRQRGTVPVGVGDAASSRVKYARQRGTVPVGVGDAASSRVKYAKVVAYQSLD